MRIVFIAALLALGVVAFAPVATFAAAEHPCYKGEPCTGHQYCLPLPKPLNGLVCYP